MKLKIALVVLLQAFVLVAMIAKKQWTLATGTPVVLATAPVDPRSLFRGDYVRLNYKISSLRLDSLAGDRNFKQHDNIYVLLQPGEADARPLSVHRLRPKPAAGQIAVKGTVEWVTTNSFPTEVAADSLQAESIEAPRRAEPVAVLISVRYGIESYFVPEGQGRILEQTAAGDIISMRVAIDRFGNAGIKAVLVNGEETYRESLF